MNAGTITGTVLDSETIENKPIVMQTALLAGMVTESVQVASVQAEYAGIAQSLRFKTMGSAIDTEALGGFAPELFVPQFVTFLAPLVKDVKYFVPPSEP